MVLAWNLIPSLIIICEVLTINSYTMQNPSFSFDDFYSTNEKKDLRKKFIDKRKQNRVTARRVQILDQYLSNNSVFIDGILHHKIDKNHFDLVLVNKIEKAFRNLIGSKGVKFTFRRDPFWRTWRKVNFTTGEKIVYYKRLSTMNCSSSASCEIGGYWAIEENPPCPFEIVSVISKGELCAINITDNSNIEKNCPSIIHFGDLTVMCDNPIDTKWRVQKVYLSEVPDRYPAILCGGRDYCEISTFYLITPEYVSFKITNSTNHIIYSRIMKYGKTNYACATDCGVINPITKTVSKIDKPLILDLINNQTKYKRRDIEQIGPKNENSEYKQFKNNNDEQHYIKFVYDYQHNHDNTSHHKHTASCSSLKKSIKPTIYDSYDENES